LRLPKIKKIDPEKLNRKNTLYFYRMSSQQHVEMSGCVGIEVDVAKMFWKSFSLSPPIESELFSPDITQRRKTAPPGIKIR
jgi:hypothetical protein